MEKKDIPQSCVDLGTHDGSAFKSSLLKRLSEVNSEFEALFDSISDSSVLRKTPEPLRRCLIFYLGHPAAFVMNKLTLPGYLKDHVNAKFESLFANDINESEWDETDETPFENVSLDDVRGFRKAVHDTIVSLIEKSDVDLPCNFAASLFWIINMGIEYETLYFEYVTMMLRQLPVDDLNSKKEFKYGKLSEHSGYDEKGNPKIGENFPKNSLQEVKEGNVVLGKTDQTYGWDNEFGKQEHQLKCFKASKFLVSNFEFLEFVEAGGYSTDKYWNEEALNWRKAKSVSHPIFWVKDKVVEGKQQYRYRLLAKIVDMPWDLPAEINNHEAAAFCSWKTEKHGKTIRMQSEAEYNRLWDHCELTHNSSANLGLSVHSPVPINSFEQKGFYDVRGNVWQHTATIFDQFAGFRVCWVVDDFSTTRFDTKHNVLKGGSWASSGSLESKFFRLAARRHFYLNAGLRYVESENPVVSPDHFYETDFLVSMYLEMHYGDKDYFGVKNFPLACAENATEACQKNGVKLGRVLDLGCAVGRSTWEFARLGFEEAIGIDLSARFFQKALKLKDLGKLHYMLPLEGEIEEKKEIDIVKLGFDKIKDRVKFYQGDASNLNVQKLGKFDLIFGGNLLCRMKVPRRLLDKVHELLNPGGMFVLNSPCTWLTDFTAKEEWIGGYKKDGKPVTTYEGIKNHVQDRFTEVKEPHEVEFVIRETKRKFQHSYSQATYWKKKD